MTQKAALNAVIVLLIAILGVLGYKLSPRFHTADRLTLPATRCQPEEQPCTAPLPGGGTLEFRIDPHPIRPLRPLKLTATLTGLNVSTVEADLTGATMEMGDNRTTLEQSHGRFTGQTILPVCITDKMEWIATIRIRTEEGQTMAIPFRFEVAGR